MKKINKLAKNDALRYHNAVAVRDEIYTKIDASPVYQKALENELDKLFTASKSSNNLVKPIESSKAFGTNASKVKTIGVLVVGLVILHETGYDTIIWNKVKTFGRKSRAKAQALKDENPDIVQKATNVKEAFVDLKDEVVDAATGEKGSHGSV